MRQFNAMSANLALRRLRLPLATVLGIAVLSAQVSCGDDSSESAADASVDQSTATPAIASGCEAVPPLRQKQVLLACSGFTHGRELQVRTERDRGGIDGCLEIYGMGDGKSRACGYVPYKRRPVPKAEIIADSLAQRNKAAPLELYGAASLKVRRILVRHAGPSTRVRTTPARLIRITDEDALAAAKLRRPFAYFVAELPAATSSAKAIARGSRGAIIGKVSFLPRPFHDLRRTNFIYATE